MEKILDCTLPVLCPLSQCVIPILTFVVSIIAIFLALLIPRKVMISQIFADLVSDYRSPEMGGAILSIFHFFVHDCKNDISNIDDEYEKKYKEQIKSKINSTEKIDFSKTLHFQRRLIAQFYFQLASLRYDYFFGRLSRKQLQIWCTPSEVKLLIIILHMAEPASKTFEEAGDIPEPPEDEVPMNDLIYKLYQEIEEWN